MTDHPDIVERLNNTAQGISLGADGMGWSPEPSLMSQAAAEITRLRAEAEALRSVMIAAAEEIQAQWPDHCDAEGYGPANLMRRLEEGIPSQYAYTAGDFVRLRDEAEALRKNREVLCEAINRTWHVLKKHNRHPGRTDDTLWDCVDAAIAATKEQQA